MKRLSRILLLLVLATHSAGADPVWRIEKNGQSLYLAGSIHILRSTDYPLPAAFETAYRAADRLVFETDIAATRDPGFMAEMERALRLPEGERLSHTLSPTLRRRIEAALQPQGLSLDDYDTHAPAMLSMTLTLLKLGKLGVNAPGVDAWLYRRARAEGKPVAQLETPSQQIAFIAAMGRGEEELLIRQTLTELETLERDFAHMAHAWRSGDLEDLDRLMLEPMRQLSPKIYRSLILQRNLAWLPKIEGFLRDPGVELVVVGSAHLAGPDGLLPALRGHGYRVRAVTDEQPAVAQ